ncbi:MAG: site-2 protease family protein [Thermoplasmata archaeon]
MFNPTYDTKTDAIKMVISKYFVVYEVNIVNVGILFKVNVNENDIHLKFEKLRKELMVMNYIPILSKEGGEYHILVGEKRPNNPWGIWVNVVLLIATILTTIYAGATIWSSYVGESTIGWNDVLYGGLFFSMPLMLILGTHELGHYFTAKYHKVNASLPFFIPVPPPFLFGTMGAFISLRDPMPDRDSLIDIGIAGPLAGLLVALPVTFIGLFLSNSLSIQSSAVTPNTLLLGSSALWYIIISMYHVNPVNAVNPMALAGWVGLFVTAINLIPAGQLDGGHIFRALGVKVPRYISFACVAFLIVIGFISYDGWILFALLIILIGVSHPPPLNDVTPMKKNRYVLVGITAFLLVSLFIITPLSQPSFNYSTTFYPQHSIVKMSTTTFYILMNVTNSDPYNYYINTNINITENYTYNTSLMKEIKSVTYVNSTDLHNMFIDVYSYSFLINSTQTIHYTFEFTVPKGDYIATIVIDVNSNGGNTISQTYSLIPPT